ncbi:hypothetical protein SYNPS1DRAFT_27387 [Syncephalis pseudoplumigaleata]|uniref:Serine-threonine protein kinase 19-domain-containing protein n=1 Tax=Syncephalis pseudoplumigaleata TaxID=1712513 RepID=A0A4P9Z314_9FUNG|nr:hypothetical protein SYNPS1DRAFT_27387 [Syncephalis pseudoplumigaleata]|eukprot:RKP26937.1 hypothetical protein SYNPS1DRAFT_27387 [Syncephalis pseudoplumigaleata]
MKRQPADQHAIDNGDGRPKRSKTADNSVEDGLTTAIDLLLDNRISPHATANARNAAASLPRLFTQHQLYIAIHEGEATPTIDATDIDRTVDRLCRRGHFVRLSVGANNDDDDDDQVLMRLVDFDATVQAACRKSSTSDDCRATLASMAGSGLLFEGHVDVHALQRHHSQPLRIADDQLGQLVAVGFLVTLDAHRHALTIPTMGRFAIQLRNGRRELAQWLRRRRNQQAPMKQVIEKRLRRATFIHNQFLVWDMLGNDQLTKYVLDMAAHSLAHCRARFDTASGWFLRLTDKGSRLCR